MKGLLTVKIMGNFSSYSFNQNWKSHFWGKLQGGGGKNMSYFYNVWMGINMFLVGAFPLREKCPTIAVTVFSRRLSSEKCPTLTVTFFFSLTLIGPLFRKNPETCQNNGKFQQLQF